MGSTRRGVLFGSSLALLSGCAQFGPRPTEIVELSVVLGNGTDEPLTFHFAFETPDGLGEWSSYDVGVNERRTVTVESPERSAFEVVHGVVAGCALSAELLDYGPGEVCPRIFFVFSDLADEPTILQSANASC